MAKIRWLVRHDMPEVLAIEAASFEYPWSEDDFMVALRQRNVIGMVAEQDNQIVGYMIYALFETRIDILNFVVHPAHRRCGIGTALAAKLIDKLTWNRRRELVVDIRDTNLVAQRFFHSQGFLATKVVRQPYWDYCDDDAYRMVYTVPTPEFDWHAVADADAVIREDDILEVARLAKQTPKSDDGA